MGGRGKGFRVRNRRAVKKLLHACLPPEKVDERTKIQYNVNRNVVFR